MINFFQAAVRIPAPIDPSSLSTVPFPQFAFSSSQSSGRIAAGLSRSDVAFPPRRLVLEFLPEVHRNGVESALKNSFHIIRDDAFARAPGNLR